LRRDLSSDTQRLPAPPVPPLGLRERINRSTGRLLAPRMVPAPVPARPPADDSAYAPAPVPVRVSSARRSVVGLIIMLTMLVVFACGAYYAISVAVDRVANIELPRPELPTLPDLGVNLPDFGIELPNWLTGIVSGGGQVWVVNIDGPEGLNLRREPGTAAEILTFLPSGTHVRQVGGPQTVDDVEWLKIRAQTSNGQVIEGWVSKRFLKPE
jgi:hypothetical protein